MFLLDKKYGWFIGLCTAILANTAWAAQPHLTFYDPFDGNINATIAAGNPNGTYVSKSSKPKFALGIRGKGLVSGQRGQAVQFAAKDNIPDNQWTITFWVKGMPGAKWTGKKTGFAEFWQLFGPHGNTFSTRLYKYKNRPHVWLYTKAGKKQKYRSLYVPDVNEQQWHFWAVTWRKQAGVHIYIDGHLVARDPDYQPITNATHFVIGQTFGDIAGMVLDEFKIYDQALAPDRIAHLSYKEGDFATSPIITVAPTAHPITIDGHIQPVEWRNATEITGLIEKTQWSVDTVPTHIFITHDATHLYMAMQSDMPPEVKQSPDTTVLHGFLKSQAIAHDTNVNLDDSFMFQAIPRFPNGDRYLFYVNGINTTYDYRLRKNLPGVQGVDLRWDPSVKVKSIVDMNGWTMELAMPIAAFGRDSIKNGEVWRMNLGRIWKMLRNRTDVWANGRRIGDKASSYGSGMGTVRFVKVPKAIVKLKKFQLQPNGRVAALIVLHNPGHTANPIDVELAANGKSVQSQTLALQPGQSKQITWDKNLSAHAGQLISIRVSSKGGKTLFDYAAPLIVHQSTHLVLWNYPSRQQLRLGWLLQSQRINPSDVSLQADLKNAQNKVLASKHLNQLPTVHGSTLIDIKDVPSGQYYLDVKLSGIHGVIQKQQLKFNKKPLPKWLGNTLGISKTPPPPWTDVKIKDDGILVWGRDYKYDHKLLPTQIINQGKNMLAGPITLAIRANGTMIQSSASPADHIQWTGQTPTRATSTRTQTLGAVTAKAVSYTEFDGMTWLKLTVSPKRAPVKVQSLTFTVPLKASWAKLINTYDYSLRQTGLLPKDGWHGKARPVWVGNGDGGIQVFQQTAATWIGSHEIQVTPVHHGKVTIRLHLIDQPTTLDKPITFAFGWIASPVKQTPKDYRNWRDFGGSLTSIYQGTQARGKYLRQASKLNPNLKIYHTWWQGWWWIPSASTFKGNYDHTGFLPILGTHDTHRRSLVHLKYGPTLISAAYGRLERMGTDNPYFAQFGDEWMGDVNGVYRPDMTIHPALQQIPVSQAAKSLRDFYAWGYHQAIDKMNLHALYFDVSRPMYDNNIYHGAGVKRQGLPPAPIYNILGTRKIFKRIYTLLKQHDPHARIFYHMSGQVLLPIDSFCSAMVDGENFTSQLNRKNNRGYEHILKLGQFRAEYAAQNNFGPVSVFLSEFSRSGAIKKDEWKTLGYAHANYILGLILLHDSRIWWTNFPENILTKAYLSLDKVGWDASWKFIPYWHQKVFNLPKGVVASLYVSADKSKVVAVVMNTSDNHDRRVSLSLAALSKKEGQSYTEVKPLYPDKPISLKDGIVSNLMVKSNNFRMFVLE